MKRIITGMSTVGIIMDTLETIITETSSPRGTIMAEMTTITEKITNLNSIDPTTADLKTVVDQILTEMIIITDQTTTEITEQITSTETLTPIITTDQV